MGALRNNNFELTFKSQRKLKVNLKSKVVT